MLFRVPKKWASSSKKFTFASKSTIVSVSFPLDVLVIRCLFFSLPKNKRMVMAISSRPLCPKTLIFRLYTAHKHANVVLYTQQPTYSYIFHTYQSVKLSFFPSSFARSCEARQLRLQKTTFTLNLNFFSLLFGAHGKLFRVIIFGL